MSLDQDVTTRPRSRGAAWWSAPWVRPTATWATVLGVIVVAVVVAVRFSRFPEWDETVFLSQSGGLEGVDARPLHMVASRELGTPVVLGVLRLVGTSLASTRVLWMALALAVLVVGLVRLGRVLGFPPAVAVAAVSTYWLSLSFWSSFFSVFLATACMLVATGLYLTLRAQSRRMVGTGIGLGLALAACLWLRQVEAVLFTMVLFGHSLVVTPRRFWPRRWRGAATAAITLVAAFGVPWVVDSVRRFGSVAARLSAARGQSFERGWDSNFSEYAGALSGWTDTYGDMTDPPTWAAVVIAVLLVAALATTLAAAVRRSSPHRRDTDDESRLGGVSLLWSLAATQLAFFWFFIGVVMDRYMVTGALLAIVAMIATAWPRLAAWHRERAGAGARWGLGPTLLVGVFALWVVANTAVASTVEAARYEHGAALEEHVDTIRSLAQDQPCRGVSRYNTPQLQFGTGCIVLAARTPDVVQTKTEQQASHGGFRFILWPARVADDVEDALGPGTQSVGLPTQAGPNQMVLFYTGDTGGDASTD